MSANRAAGHDADDDALHEGIREATDEVGHKELLWLLGDCDRTTLANRLACRDHREPTVRILLRLVRAQGSGKLLTLLCRLAGYTPPKRLIDESPTEKLERLIEAVRRDHGATGEQTIASVFATNREPTP